MVPFPSDSGESDLQPCVAAEADFSLPRFLHPRRGVDLLSNLRLSQSGAQLERGYTWKIILL